MLRKRPTNAAMRVSAEPTKTMTITPQTIKGDKKLHPFTHEIEFLGVGKARNGDRYLKRRVGTDVALVSVAKLLSDPKEEYVRLQRAGVILLRKDGQNRFINCVEAEASEAKIPIRRRNHRSNFGAIFAIALHSSAQGGKAQKERCSGRAKSEGGSRTS